jgi:hypothetical protein
MSYLRGNLNREGVIPLPCTAQKDSTIRVLRNLLHRGILVAFGTRFMPAMGQKETKNLSAVTAAFAETGHGILAAMSTRPRSPAREPMTLGNMRANGLRSLDVSCRTSQFPWLPA